jgi:hypothetical protein
MPKKVCLSAAAAAVDSLRVGRRYLSRRLGQEASLWTWCYAQEGMSDQ